MPCRFGVVPLKTVDQAVPSKWRIVPEPGGEFVEVADKAQALEEELPHTL
jgi:hypothetical protein